MRRSKFVLSVSTIVMLLCLIAPAPAKAQLELKFFSITKGRLVFAYRARNSRSSDLAMVNFENLEFEKLTNTPYSESHPRWSPDGRWIAFDSNKDGNRDIFVMSWDGTLTKQVTATEENEEAPDWSPDGSHIVFYRRGDKRKVYLYKIRPDGSDETPLSSQLPNASMPRWSPIGDEVLFSTDAYWPGWDLGVVKLPSGEKAPISAGKRSYARASWHPKGHMVTFGYGSGDDFDIYAVNKGEKKPTKIAGREGRDTDPEWDDSGRYLFFSSEVSKGERNYQVYVKDLESGETHQVTAGPGFIRFPSYSPHPTLQKFAPQGVTLTRPKRFFEEEEEGEAAEGEEGVEANDSRAAGGTIQSTNIN